MLELQAGVVALFWQQLIRHVGISKLLIEFTRFEKESLPTEETLDERTLAGRKAHSITCAAVIG